MKKTLLAVVLASCATSVFAASVSISVGQPGFYGQINIGGYPQPQVIYPQAVIIQRDPGYRGGPIYLRVPPGYEKHWSRHCRAYRACDRPVYFVRDNWYNREYVPRYRERHGHHDEHGHGHGHGHGHDHGHQDH